MSVNSYLTDLASALVLSSTEKDHISTSVETIKTRLSLYFSTEVEEKKYLVRMFAELSCQEKQTTNQMLTLWWYSRTPMAINHRHFLIDY